MPRIPLFPLDVVLFPGEPFGLHIFEERYLLMTEECLAEDLPIGIVLARQDEPDDRVEHDPESSVGTAARILQAERVEDRFLLQTLGTRRFRIEKLHHDKPYQEADVAWLDEPAGDRAQADELASRLLAKIEDAGARIDWDSPSSRDPIAVSHAVASTMPFDLGTKQRLLEAPDAEQRLRVEAQILESVL